MGREREKGEREKKKRDREQVGKVEREGEKEGKSEG